MSDGFRLDFGEEAELRRQLAGAISRATAAEAERDRFGAEWLAQLELRVADREMLATLVQALREEIRARHSPSRRSAAGKAARDALNVAAAHLGMGPDGNPQPAEERREMPEWTANMQQFRLYGPKESK